MRAGADCASLGSTFSKINIWSRCKSLHSSSRHNKVKANYMSALCRERCTFKRGLHFHRKLFFNVTYLDDWSHLFAIAERVGLRETWHDDRLSCGLVRAPAVASGGWNPCIEWSWFFLWRSQTLRSAKGEHARQPHTNTSHSLTIDLGASVVPLKDFS